MKFCTWLGVSREEKKRANNSAGVRDRKRSTEVHADAKLQITRHVCDRVPPRLFFFSVKFFNFESMLYCGPSSPFRAFLQYEKIFRYLVGSDRRCPLHENSFALIFIESHKACMYRW